MRLDADALARFLDLRRHSDAAGDDERLLVAFAQALQPSAVLPSAEFRADLRARLLAEAVVVLHRPPLLARLRTRAEDAGRRLALRMAAVTGAAALSLSGAGVAAAAEHALPGDVLYGVKLALEDVRVLLVDDTAARGQRQLAYAQDRVTEAAGLAERGAVDEAASALRAADALAGDGTRTLIQAHLEGSDDALAVVRAFAASQRQRLQALLGTLDGGAVVAARDALAQLERIEEQVVVLAAGGRTPTPPPRLDVPLPVAPAPLEVTVIPAPQQTAAACPCPPGEPVVIVQPRPSGLAPESDPAPAGTEVPAAPVPTEPAVPPEAELLPDRVPAPVAPLVDVVEEVLEGVLERTPVAGPGVIDAAESTSAAVDRLLGADEPAG